MSGEPLIYNSHMCVGKSRGGEVGDIAAHVQIKIRGWFMA